MVSRRLPMILNIVLALVTIEDTLLFVMAWLRPSLWFRIFHHTVPASFDTAFLRRSAGQWFAFALAQTITLVVWRKRPVWLLITAGLRFSDLFTDASYIFAAPSLTTFGYLCLLPPPVLNLVFIVLLLAVYRQTMGPKKA